jgi:hypothetical protein
VRKISSEDEIPEQQQVNNAPITKENILEESKVDPSPPKVAPNVSVLADNLTEALFADRNNEVAQIANILADSASARKYRNSLNARFGKDFYSKAVQFFDTGNEPGGASLAGLLGKLQDLDALSPIFDRKFSSISIKGRRYCVEVLKGFSNYSGKERCEIITWLVLQRYWETSEEIIDALKEAFSAFKLPAVSSNTITLATRLQTALAIRNYADAADYALALYGDRNLNYSLASNESNRRIFNDGDFYDNALKVIRAENPCQSRSLALFLSKLQTKKLREKICNDKLWDQSDAEEKRLYLFILGSFTVKTEQRNRVIEWLQERQNNESGDIPDAIRQTLAKIR